MGATSKRCVGVFVEAIGMRKRSNYQYRTPNPEAWKIAMQGSMLLPKADQIARTAPVSDAVTLVSQGKAT